MIKEIPIVLFVYNRIDVLRETCNALKNNHGISENKLYIYCDGPKLNSTDEEIKQISIVKEYVKEINWCKEVIIKNRESNLGLSKSIVTGISEILEEYEAVIVLEDDIKTSPYFLKYMISALNEFQNNEEVISITGFNYPIRNMDLDSDIFFIKGTECWSWGTWRRGWELYIEDGKYLYDELKRAKSVREFNFNNTYNYFLMLKKTIVKNHSWAIKWYASAFLHNKLTVYPKYSMVENIGYIGENNKTYHPELMGKISSKGLLNFKSINIVENMYMRQQFEKHFKRNFNNIIRLKKYLKNRIYKLWK